MNTQKTLEELQEILPNKFTFVAMLWRLDNNMADYGNQDMNFGDYYDDEDDDFSISNLTEDGAEEVFFLNGGDVEVISALIEYEKLNEGAEYDEEDLTEEYKSLPQQDKNRVDKYLFDLSQEIGFD